MNAIYDMKCNLFPWFLNKVQNSGKIYIGRAFIFVLFTIKQSQTIHIKPYINFFFLWSILKNDEKCTLRQQAYIDICISCPKWLHARYIVTDSVGVAETFSTPWRHGCSGPRDGAVQGGAERHLWSGPWGFEGVVRTSVPEPTATYWTFPGLVFMYLHLFLYRLKENEIEKGDRFYKWAENVIKGTLEVSKNERRCLIL